MKNRLVVTLTGPLVMLIVISMLSTAFAYSRRNTYTRYRYDFKSGFYAYHSYEFHQDDDPEAWYWHDFKDGGSWEWSSDVAHKGEHSAMMKTADHHNRHHIVIFTKYPFEDFTYVSYKVWFYLPDITKATSIGFATDKFTGERRMTAAVQYLPPIEEGGLRWDGSQPRWRYFKGGPYGKNNVGMWMDIEGAEQQLASNTWHYLRLVVKYPLTNGVDANDDSAHTGRYYYLRVDDRRFDLWRYKIGPAPIEAPSSTFRSQKRIVLEMCSRKKGSSIIYYDDVYVSYTVGN